jgi:hypothetical protein
MKQCRFCDAEVPFYGSDTCAACQERSDAAALERAKKSREVMEIVKLFDGEIRKARSLRGDSPW